MHHKSLGGLIIGLCFLFCACVPPPAPPPHPAGPRAPVFNVKPGQEFKIILDSNPTTGYRWVLAKPLDAKVLKLISGEYRRTPGTEHLVGAGGQETWRFLAVAPGEAVLEFQYLRPWEKDKPPARRHVVRVIIN